MLTLTTVKGRTLAVFSLATALWACATPPPAPAPVAAPELGGSTKLSDAARDWPKEDWWAAYNDPVLSHLIEEALQDAPSMTEAEARLRAAEASARAIGASRLPVVSADASAAESKQSYNNGIPPEFVPQGYNDVGRASLNFQWEIDFWGKNRAAIAAATSRALAAEADLAQARLIVSTSIASAYADLKALERDRDIAQQALEVRNKTLDLVQQRVDNGLDTEAQLSQAEAGPPSARADIKAIDEQISLTRNRLAALVGSGPDRGLDIDPAGDGPVPSFGLPENLPANLLGRRPDIVAARWMAEAQRSTVQEARAAFYPNINLTAAIGVQSLYLDRLLDSGSDTGSVGPAISLPIFEGGRLRANLANAEAQNDVAASLYKQTIVEALHEVADAADSIRALDGRLKDSRDALAATEKAYSLTQLRYHGGLDNFQAVLLVEQQLLAERRSVADLESRRLKLDIALVRALGGGFKSDANPS